MNESKRQFLQVLPLVALGGLAVKAGEHTTCGLIEIRPDKRYVLKITDCAATQDDLDSLKANMVKHGLDDVLVIAGPAEIYELEQSAK